MSSLVLPSPVGFLTIVSNGRSIVNVSFAKRKSSKGKIDKILLRCRKELKEYFDGTREKFSVSLLPQSTEFQKIVWREMLRVPSGKTISYKELAKHVGRPKAIRAAASACGKNPIVILIPCHRIVASNGRLGGYSGGIAKKRWLLEREKTL